MTCPFQIGDLVEDTTMKIAGCYPKAIILDTKFIQGGHWTVRVLYYGSEETDDPVLQCYWPVQDFRLIGRKTTTKTGFSEYITSKGL